MNRLPILDPPGMGARLATYLGSNVAELKPDSPFPELRPRDYPIHHDRLCREIPVTLMDLGWAWQSAGDCRYRAVVTTPLLRFRDDVSIEVQSLGGNGARLQVRSQSRVGRGDLGANTRHVLDLISALEQRLSLSESD